MAAEKAKVNEQLKLLIDLQRLDSLMLSSLGKIETIPLTITAEEAPLKAAQDAFEKAEQNHAALEKKKREREQAVDDLSEKIRKLKSRSSEIKTNKEYQAHLKEIDSAEAELRRSEDELLAFMERLEETSAMIKDKKLLLNGEREKQEARKKTLEKEKAVAETDLLRLKEQRKKLAEAIDSDNYRLYMEILKLGRGLAVVETKQEICQGCNLHIPPQLFVEIKSNTEIMQCPQCKRILYYVRPDDDVPHLQDEKPGQPAAPASEGNPS